MSRDVTVNENLWSPNFWGVIPKFGVQSQSLGCDSKVWGTIPKFGAQAQSLGHEPKVISVINLVRHCRNKTVKG